MQKRCATVLIFALLAALCCGCAPKDPLDTALAKTESYYQNTEIVIGADALSPCFARLGRTGWQDGYRASVLAVLEDGEIPGALATDYARVVLGLTAAGFDARNLDGHDLTAPLASMEFVRHQGLNGVVWTLLALDSGGYDPSGGDTSRDALLAAILEFQLPDGGFAYSGTDADPDMTAMVLQALAPYRDQPPVDAAVDTALGTLAAIQDADGGYSSWGTASCESCAQVLLALCALELAPDDARFVRDGSTVLDAMLCYQQRDGGFSHIAGGDTDASATAQAYSALLALQRQRDGGGRFYDFTD